MHVSLYLLDLETCMDERIDIGINGPPVAGTLIFILQNPYQVLGIQDVLLIGACP